MKKDEVNKSKHHERLAIYISIAAFIMSLTGFYLQYFYSNYTLIAKVNYFDRFDFQTEIFDYRDYGYNNSISPKLNLSLVNTGNTNQYLTDVIVSCEAVNKKGLKSTIEYYKSPELNENVFELKPNTRVLKSFEMEPMLFEQIDGDILGEYYLSLYEEINGSVFESIISQLYGEVNDEVLENRASNQLPKCDLKVQLGFLGVDGAIYYKNLSSNMKSTDTIFSLGFADNLELYSVNDSVPVKFDVTDSKDGDEILSFLGYEEIIKSDTHILDAGVDECTFIPHPNEYWYKVNTFQSEYASIRLSGNFNDCKQLGVKYYSVVEGVSNNRFYGEKIRFLPGNKWVVTHDLDSQWTDIKSNPSGEVHFKIIAIPVEINKKIEFNETWCHGAELQGTCIPSINIGFLQYLSTIKLPTY